MRYDGAEDAALLVAIAAGFAKPPAETRDMDRSEDPGGHDERHALATSP